MTAVGKTLTRTPDWRIMCVMGTNRRYFLGLSFAATVAVGIRGAFGAPVAAGATPAPLKSLPAFLDTLIPEDDSPSATGVGVDHLLIKKAAGPGQQLYQGLLRLGCRWLDREAVKSGARDFSALPPGKQEEIVARAASSTKGSLPRAFFDIVQKDSFHFYYADARTWTSLRYDGPPQPAGFDDHANPPGHLRP